MKTVLRITLILDKVAEIAASEDAVVVAVCAAIESEIAELDNEEKSEFLPKWA